jgi:competence protein ComEA
MPDIAPARQLALLALAVVAVLALGGWYVSRGGPAAAPAPEAIAVHDGGSHGGGGSVVVHVAGAVHRPGLYRLRAGSRVADALGRAGGPRPRADLTQVNLAAKVEDGRQILVPRRVVAAPAGGGAAAAQPGVPLNLNTATLEQLDELPGVGPATAQKILDYREEHGGFGSVEELGQVPGIGDVRLASLREQVRV